MMELTEIVPSIHRLVIPFEDIYTTVFIIQMPSGAILFDTATYESDVDDYILPTLHELGVSQDALKYIILSHSHRDHAGGLERLMKFFPCACIVSQSKELISKCPDASFLCPDDGHLLLNTLQIIAVPGHAPDSIALFDRRTRTLLTGDSLQLYGIYGSGKWGANISKPAEHLKAVEALCMLDIDTVIASHNYHPCGYIARGPEEIGRYFSECRAALYSIRDYICAASCEDDSLLAEQYNLTSGLPTVGSHVFRAVRAAGLK